MTPTTAAIVRELESVARELRREAKDYRRFVLTPMSKEGRAGLIKVAQGLEDAAYICTHRASALRAKAKRKGRK